jgi:hypothetical protein
MVIHVSGSEDEAPERGSPAYPDQRAIKARGVFGRVLSLFRPDLAKLCPDLIHEAEMGMQRRP